jgi:hypothetical protein
LTHIFYFFALTEAAASFNNCGKLQQAAASFNKLWQAPEGVNKLLLASTSCG